MTGKRIGYKRVSTAEQNPDRQLEGIALDKVFIEYASGVTTNRPQLQAMLEYVREDDTIIVHSMDRLARNVKDLRNLIDDLVKRKIAIEFTKENLRFCGDNTPMAYLLLNIMGSIAEFERELIRERQLEGIAIAKRAGKYRREKKVLQGEKIEQINALMLTRKTKTAIAKELGISRFTLYNYLARIRSSEKEQQ